MHFVKLCLKNSPDFGVRKCTSLHTACPLRLIQSHPIRHTLNTVKFCFGACISIEILHLFCTWFFVPISFTGPTLPRYKDCLLFFTLYLKVENRIWYIVNAQLMFVEWIGGWWIVICPDLWSVCPTVCISAPRGADSWSADHSSITPSTLSS